MQLIKSFWFNRFQVYDDGEYLIFFDILIGKKRKIVKLFFSSFQTVTIDLAYLKFGFFNSAILFSPRELNGQDGGFLTPFDWQFPCITEKKAYENHLSHDLLDHIDKGFHIYIGFPWATLIDRKTINPELFKRLNLILSGYKNILLEYGIQLHIHSVCQHIYWEQCIELWAGLGFTDIWLSHKEADKVYSLPFEVHPWPLFSVNVEDQDRCSGIKKNIHPRNKKYLASFIGTHADHYLTESRKKLKVLEKYPDFYIKFTNQWHFEKVVYDHQIEGSAIADCYFIDETVFEYNDILSNSKFTLCPSGSGPNTLRLWEALAVGSVPILLGRHPALPEGAGGEEIHWDNIMICIDDDQIEHLPQILSSYSNNEIYQRQQNGLLAYEYIKGQKCF